MAEYTIPKPYRDFYVTDPYIATQKEVEELQEYSYPRSQVEYGSILHGENTLPDKEIPVKVESKNLIPFPYADVNMTRNEIIFTIGNDGGISLEGTATAYTNFKIYSGSLEGLFGDKTQYINASLSGTFSNVSLILKFYNGDTYIKTITVNETYNPQLIDLNTISNATKILLLLEISSGNTPTGTVYPQLEKGDISTSYSLYQPEGTPVTVTTCGKNLLDVPSNFSLSGYTSYKPLVLRKGKTYTISCSNVTLGGDNNPVMVMYDSTSTPYESYSLSPATPITVTLYRDIKQFRLWSNGYSDSASTGITSTINNLMIEESHVPTTYEAYTESVTGTTVGSNVICKQLNDNTTIFSNSLAVSLSTQFVLSNEELFHDKLTTIIGLFANRPTNITDYDRLYIATDKTDTSRSTILPAGKSGATASNWIYI